MGFIKIYKQCKKAWCQFWWSQESRPIWAAAICGVLDMKDQYDFSKSIKNPYLRSPKKQITIRLDEEIILYFKGMSEGSGIPYQSVINLYLRDCVAEKKQLQLKWASWRTSSFPRSETTWCNSPVHHQTRWFWRCPVWNRFPRLNSKHMLWKFCGKLSKVESPGS